MAHCLLLAVWTVLLLQWIFHILVCFTPRVASSVDRARKFHIRTFYLEESLDRDGEEIVR